MSDDEYDFDTFAVDASFLQQVDLIESRASEGTANSSASASVGNRPRQAPIYPQSIPSAAVTNPPFKPPSRAETSSGTTQLRSVTADGGPSRRAAALGIRLARPQPMPSSDDFDDVSFTAESLAQIDEVATTGGPSVNGMAGRQGTLQLRDFRRTTSNSTPSTSGSSERRRFARTSSTGQTHLNFRRETPYTKGKRWDRTAFAATGRRIGAEKKKKNGKRAYEDDEDEDEDDMFDEGEPLAPNPAPLVDMNKPYGPMKHHYDEVAIKDYIYPINHPKRDYQYDIIRECFTDNCLVALPTGLGKTFVAGVVMLNFYRWFPTGKIVFLAPTKPLVNQQIEACQLTCGIPSADAAVMTGESVSAKRREQMWDEKRVFYCTPQTLDNDLKRGSVDPCDIVLAVFDEAHKASGSYAYTTILAYITAHHPYFRVLALTATPGGDVEKVQGVVDALHISRIEIREAEAPEIRKYMNEKKTEKHVVRMGPMISELRDRWAALMKPFISKLVEKNILTERDLDAKRLRPFRLTAKRMELMRDRQSGLLWALGPLGNLERMARAMTNLLEFSIDMFHTTIMEIAGHSTSSGKKGNTKAGANSIRNNIEFQRMLKDVEEEINEIEGRRNGKTGADRHPKMHKTLELLLAHFAQAEEDESVHGTKNDTRAMVFCSFRECVLNIVDMLNEHPALLRATKFVGQSQGKLERDKGFKQKDQKQTIQDFKDGKFNVLVATSIGEEGLDIGEVDFVVIYDMPKQSIKLLQRIGRTGRKRDGHVHVLMSELREDSNWDTAQQTHRDIQEEILHSRNLELFEDVERLLPRGPLPHCLEQEMDIDPWDPADQRKTKLPGSQGKSVKQPKPKAVKARRHEIPKGAQTGFKSVAELIKMSMLSANSKRGHTSSDEDGSERLMTDDEKENEAAQELLYASVSAGRGKKTQARPRGKKAKT